MCVVKELLINLWPLPQPIAFKHGHYFQENYYQIRVLLKIYHNIKYLIHKFIREIGIKALLCLQV